MSITKRNLLYWFGWLLLSGVAVAAELQQKTLAAWDAYVRLTEQRIGREVADPQKFLVLDFDRGQEAQKVRAQLRSGQLAIRKMQTVDESGHSIEVNGGMIHHWVGAVFVPGAHLDQVLDWVHDYGHHAGRFPEVIASKLISHHDDTFQFYLKLRRKKIITVYYDTYYSATNWHKSPNRVYSFSHSTKIAQLAEPDTPQEHEMPVGEDSGFLWRLNSYWRYEEADGGVYVECESVSLSRAVPTGLGWVAGGFVDTVPRESLEDTLTSIRKGVSTTLARK